MTCAACGQVLKPDARFCGKCGAPIVASVPTPAYTPAAPPTPSTLERFAAGLDRRWIAAGSGIVVVAILIIVAISAGLSAAHDQRPATDEVDAQSASDADGGNGSTVGDTDATTQGAGVSLSPAVPLPASTAQNPSFFAVPSWRRGVWFVSPSGNLSCGIGGDSGDVDFWGCAIRQRDWNFASSSPGEPCYQSEVTCGDGIAVRVGQVADDVPAPLNRGGAEFPDEGGLAVNILQYGQSVRNGTVTCASTFSNVVCVDSATGHGFVISRNENTIF